MVGFSWNHWVSALSRIARPKSRRPRVTPLARIEGLEVRALLTANLPVANNDAYQVDANTTLNASSVLANDSDADGDIINQVILNSSVSHGTLNLSTDGSFTYTPDTNFSGIDSFTYFARDSANAENSAGPATVTITVGTANLAPVAEPVTINVATDTPFVGGLEGSDSENDPLTFSAGSIAPSNGTVSINLDGSFTYTPGPGYTGPDSFTFKVNDGTSDSADALVTVNVGTGANHAPTAISVSILVATDTQFAGFLSGNDIDGNPLTFAQGSTLAAHGTVSIGVNGDFTYTPDVGFTGTDSFSFSVSDGTFSSVNDGIVSVQVSTPNGGNTPPVADAVEIAVGLNTTFAGGLSGSDADGDPFTFQAGSTVAAHGSVVINPNGTFTYTPDTGYTGTDSFSFLVNDGTDNSAEALVSVQVGTSSNTPPVADSVAIEVAPNTTFAGGLSGSDIDGDPLAFAAGTTVAAHGSVTINPNGSFTYTPNPGYTGPDSFSFLVNDGTADSAEALVAVQVTASANSPPVATPVSINVGLNTTFSGFLSGTDVNGDPLTFQAGSTTAAHGSVNINPNGSFTYTPDSGYTGSDSFSFFVNDGTTNSAAALVSVQVGTAGNSQPTANSTSISVLLNTAYSGTLSGSDVDGDPLTFLPGAIQAAHGSVILGADGSFIYNPTPGYTGSDAFSFLVNDGTVDSAEALVFISVGTTSNTAPVASPANISVQRNTTFLGTLTGIDANGDVLYFAAGSTGPAHGTVVIHPNGTFTYTPATGFTGSDAFSFKVNDGTLNSADATVSVTVFAATNTPPNGVPVTVITTVDSELSGTLTGTDADGDPLTFALGSTAPAHGSVTVNSDGTYIYTPDAGYTGFDLFTFRVNDGTANSSPATVIVSIRSIANIAPTVTNGSAAVATNATFDGSVSALAIDPEGDPLTFAVGTPPQHGTLVLSPDGNFIYTPDTNFTGADQFTFTANDGALSSNLGTFNLSVSDQAGGFTVVLSPAPGTIATSPRDVTPLDPGATLVNVNPAVTFADATVTAQIVSGAARQDRVLLTEGGTVDIRGRKVRVNGIEVARISRGGRGQPLEVIFNSNATVDSVQAVVQRIGVKTTRRAAGGSRVVEITVNADGFSSSASIVADKA